MKLITFNLIKEMYYDKNILILNFGIEYTITSYDNDGFLLKNKRHTVMYYTYEKFFEKYGDAVLLIIRSKKLEKIKARQLKELR